nr:endonuclease/exonuclease/phosphatase family protein [Mangrovicoccus algicola]
MLHTNPLSPARLVEALAASPADVIVLTEATPLQGSRALLETRFPVVLGCGGRRCDIMILLRDPAIGAQLLRMPSTGTERLAALRLPLPDGEELHVAAVHMLKPWYYGLSASDQWMVTHQAATAPGPLVVVGDFNAAPWSKRLRKITTRCGLDAPRRPVATWPARLGGAGIPIDLPLTRGGAVLRSASAWGGAALGSNHRGLLLDIGYLPGNGSPPPEGCTVPAALRAPLNLPAAPPGP